MEEADLNKKGQEAALVFVASGNCTPSWSARDLLATGFRHKGLLIVCFCGIVLLVLLATILKPRQYESEAKVLVKHERADPLVTAGAEQVAALDRNISEEELNSELELIRSEDLLRKVVLTCGLAGSANDQRKRERSFALAVARLRPRLKVAAIRKTNILSISYTSPSPELSARVVNTVVSSYLEKHVAAHSVSSELEFFDQQVAQYRQELAKAEEALTKFSENKGGTVSPAMQRDAVLQRKHEFNALLQQTYSAIAETQQRIRTLKNEVDSTPARVTTQLRSADNPQLMQDLKATLLRLQLRRTELLSKYQPSYPLVQEVDQELANARAALASAERSPLRDSTTDVNPIRQWIDSELKKAEAELRSLQSRADKVTGIVQAYDREAHYMDGQQLRHEDLERNAKSAEENYLLYVRKREEARITNALDQRRILNVTVIEPATHPSLPSSSKLYYLIMGLLLAIVITTGLLLTLEHVDNTFRTPHQLEQFVQVPVLATVPLEHWLSSDMKRRKEIR